ncbi:hypothetical protein G6L28_13290 [Agrobacterium larrymoorei]|uniref:stealth conserved region 3 domain-containing protein n=1 Tax=Agrobacterium larrymoorei TaxID=160699 RepID=UPI001572B9FB|nr:stealth conserved region 3 domain-containing protein [Agrobacterium larrymoorei]NTJ43576.1 hypothetical protein [Agrobacterium larrymoorei]
MKKLLFQCEHFETKSLHYSDVHCGAIDVVYTWVSSTDVGWKTLIEQFAAEAVIDNDRFSQDDELRYSIRSLFTFAPWVRNVFIFTNCAPPEWFIESERIRWIMHHEVIPEKYLPLFNSHAIETFLHEIPGLSERYLYFNDDVFLAAPVNPTDFFTSYGQSLSRMEAEGTTHYLRNVVAFENAEGWQSAAVNASALLRDYTGIWPTRLHCHTPHALLKTLYYELTDLFPDELETTRQAKFRAHTDFSITSFLYHHFAFSKGRAIPFYENAMVIRSTNFNRVIKKRDFKKSRFFCINDGGGSAGDVSFRKFKSSFLSRRFPFRSPAERVTGDLLQ